MIYDQSLFDCRFHYLPEIKKFLLIFIEHETKTRQVNTCSKHLYGALNVCKLTMSKSTGVRDNDFERYKRANVVRIIFNA